MCDYRRKKGLPSYAEAKGIKESTPKSERNLLEKELKRRETIRAEKKVEYCKLVEEVRKAFEDNKRVYGYRKMQRELMKRGLEISEYKVRKIMMESGMYSVVVDTFKAPRKRNPDGRFHENLVRQEFNPSKLNEIWVGDITYIKTVLGWVYLAAVMDLYNRKIIGYAIGKTIDTELVKRALSNACIRSNAEIDTIFHSNRGKQYASIEDVKKDLFEYIELFYNRKRMHESLGYMSQVEYRQACVERRIA